MADMNDSTSPEYGALSARRHRQQVEAAAFVACLAGCDDRTLATLARVTRDAATRDAAHYVIVGRFNAEARA